MGFAQAIQSCFRQYATFSGRAPRSEYWYFSLFCSLVVGVTVVVHPVLAGIAYAAIFLPGISVVVRRLHDTDKSGWNYWFALIPIVGAILLLVWFCTKGTDGDNGFGPDPLAGTEPPARPISASPAGPLSINDKAEQLAKLKALLEMGAIS
jgi:uncharacterized membrane protein YhaH (DUF805 family)